MKYSFIAVLLILCTILVYGMYQYVRVAALIQKGRLLANNAIPYERSGDYLTSFLVVGDSTAVGVGASSVGTSVSAYLAEAFTASIENHAKSGARLGQIREQIMDATVVHYDFVLIQGGANDVMFGSSYETVESETDVILTEALKLSNRVIFLTAGDIGEAPLWPWPIDWYMTQRTKKVRSIIMQKAEALGVLYVDLYTLPTPFKEDPKRYYAPDFLHLSSEGYAVWATLIRSEVFKRWGDAHEQT